MDFDTILVNHIGQFGRYNIKVLCLLVVVVTFAVFSASSYMFTTAQISSRCFIPECDSDNPEFSPAWIHNAIPGSNGSLEQCTRYIGVSNTTNDVTCPATLFDSSATTSCENGIVYESANSIVNDFDLGCNEWKRAFVGSMRAVGTVLGLGIWGVCSDRWGRKRVMVSILFVSCLFGLCKYWANSYIVFTVLEVMEAFFESGVYPCSYVLFMELVGPDYREKATASVLGLTPIGNLLLALFAWKIQNWRNLVLALYAPQILIISYYWLLPESTRWLISKERFDEAEKNIKNAAKTNNTTISESVLLDLRRSTQKKNIENSTEQEKRNEEPWLIVTIFKEKSLLLRCIVAPIWSITVNFIFYGLQINAVNLAGNSYVNFMAVSVVDLPGFWSTSILMKWFGRKKVLSACFFLCALCQIGNIFVTSDFYALSLFLYIFGKLLVSMSAAGLYIYTAELFPTKYRQSLFSYTSMMGNLGAIVAPFTPALSAMVWTELPFALYGGFAFLSSLLVLLTPETKNINLPDTIDEALSTKTKQYNKIIS